MNFSKNVAKFVVNYTLPKLFFLPISFSKKHDKFCLQKKPTTTTTTLGKKLGGTTKLLSSVECYFNYEMHHVKKAKHKSTKYVHIYLADPTLGKMFQVQKKGLTR